MYQSYYNYCKSHHWKELLGAVFIIVSDNSDQLIANLFGQITVGTYSRQTDYIALRKGLEFIKEYAEFKNYSVCLPYKMSCGLAGGNWDETVFPMIQDIFENSKIKVVIYKLEGVE